VTVTHPEVRRFFMLIPEAVQLVLHAAAQADNGATYVLEMGEQVKLVDMARHLIRLSGLVPEEDIAIKFVGLRPAEKLSEELVGDGETVRPSRVEKIQRVSSHGRTSAAVLRSISAIEQRAWDSDSESVIALLGRLLPAYNRVPETVADLLIDPVYDPTTSPATEAPVDALARVTVSCHHCHRGILYRSHARTLLERARRALGEKRLFACDECNWRGWLVPVEVAAVTVAETPLLKPDLREIDAAVALIPFFPGRTRPSNLL